MEYDKSADYYETLQISPNADPDTRNRVYRILAQRFHPDNQDSGSEERFRQIHQAYSVLSDPEKRAQYDIKHQGLRQERWRFVANSATAENDFEMEQLVRFNVLEVLYTRRRVEPNDPGLSPLDLEKLIGRPREHLEFTIWFLVQKKMLTRGDHAHLIITAEGVEYLEQNFQSKVQRLRLKPKEEESKR